MARVTIVLTSYNHDKFVDAAIDSVLCQTFRDFELIVLDDASTDTSWERISLHSDPRLRALRSNAPGEVVRLTTQILAEASSEYIAIHQSDDLWAPEKLQRQIEYLDANPSIGAVFTWAQVIDEDGHPSDNDWFNQPNTSRWERLNELFHQKNSLNHPSVLIRKRCYDEAGGYRFGLAQIDDAEFWSRVLLRYPIHVIEEKLTLHRLFSDKSNISGDRPTTAVRRENEWNFLRENYLTLSGFVEVIQVFPELASWQRPNGCNVKFLLAMACVQSPHRSAWSQGLRWLFELLNDPAQQAQIADLYGYTDTDFVALSAKLDCYAQQAMREQGQALAEHIAQVQAERARAQEEHARAQDERNRAQAERDRAQAEHARAQAEHARAQDEHVRAQAEAARANTEHGRAAAAVLEARHQHEQLQDTQAHLQQVAAHLATIEASASWRITAPLRRFATHRPRTARMLLRAAKLAWWTVTLQLPRRLHEWQTRRQTSAPPIDTVPTEVVPAPAPSPAAPQSQVEVEVEIRKLSAWLAAARPFRHGIAHAALAPDQTQTYFNNLGLPPTEAQAWARLIDTLHAPDVETTVELAQAASLMPYPHIKDLVTCLLGNPLFDADHYGRQIARQLTPEEAALHYLLIGEPLGIPPSPSFDPVYYRLRYPDMGAACINGLLHYIYAGQYEKRRPTAPRTRRGADAPLIDPDKENVIVVVHETSRTGAPVLGWNIACELARRYNVFSVLLRDGDLTPAFEAVSCETLGSFDGWQTHPLDIDFALAPWLADRRFKYALVNSIESRSVLAALASHGVPSTLLIHEYGTYVWPASALRQALDTATEVVFPAASVARSSLEVHPPLQQRGYHIAAQGMSLLPTNPSEEAPALNEQLLALQRQHAEGMFLVTGAGSVNLRKGVDIFLAVAADVKRIAPDRAIHFLWIGDGYKPTEDMGYSIYLKEQLARSGVQADVTLMNAIPDLEAVYAMTDAFLLTSRLDPLPNVSIDAVRRGIPVICFQEASGMADLLLSDPETAVGVVPYMDVRGAADVIVRLDADEPLRERLARASLRFGEEAFNMERYVAKLDELASASAQHQRIR